MLHDQFMKTKEQKYLASIPEVSLDQLEQNIIVGSILGDGSLTYSPRSRNAYFREHFSLKQKEYREWKSKNIHSFSFRIENGCHLKSPSHPVFSMLYDRFFINGTKTITPENIKLLNHPIDLACLYMDDGTLMISASKRKKVITIHSTVGITTLCFSKAECEILVDYIQKVFDIKFYLCSNPYGKGWTIQFAKLKQIIKFFNLIKPYCSEVSCLKYKWDWYSRMELKKQALINEYGKTFNIEISSVNNIPNYYSLKDEEIIYAMRRDRKTSKEIVDALGRSYWGVTYKIQQMKQQGKI